MITPEYTRRAKKNYYIRIKNDPEKHAISLEKGRARYQKLKETPEEYQAFLEKKRLAYHNKKHNVSNG